MNQSFGQASWIGGFPGLGRMGQPPGCSMPIRPLLGTRRAWGVPQSLGGAIMGQCRYGPLPGLSNHSIRFWSPVVSDAPLSGRQRSAIHLAGVLGRNGVRDGMPWRSADWVEAHSSRLDGERSDPESSSDKAKCEEQSCLMQGPKFRDGTEQANGHTVRLC